MNKEKQIEEMAFNLIMATSPLGVKDLTKQFDYYTVAKDLYELYGWRKQSEWISVEERLPPAGKGVLVCFDHSVSIDIVRSDGQWDTFNADSSKCVTHWAPIPKMPFPKISIPRVSEDDEKGR